MSAEAEGQGDRNLAPVTRGGWEGVHDRLMEVYELRGSVSYDLAQLIDSLIDPGTSRSKKILVVCLLMADQLNHARAEISSREKTEHLRRMSQDYRALQTSEAARQSALVRALRRSSSSGGPRYASEIPGYAREHPGYSREHPGYSREHPGYSREHPGYTADNPWLRLSEDQKSLLHDQSELSADMQIAILRLVASEQPKALLNVANRILAGDDANLERPRVIHALAELLLERAGESATHQIRSQPKIEDDRENDDV